MKLLRSPKPARASREQRAAPELLPRLVYAREEQSGSQKQTDEASRILVVEDDYLVGAQIETALEEGGFAVTGVAVSADEAIQMATAHRPALAIMDIRLAGKRDGIDAAIELFRGLGIRCIFATAHYDKEARERAQAANPLGWLQKPYTMHSLVEAVRRALKEPEGR